MTTHVREQHWADDTAAQIAAVGHRHEISTGISPSGEIHIGNLREVITADVVARALRERGVEVVLDYVADNFDPLRKVYPFLDRTVYEPLIGAPLSEIPCPCGKHRSYAEHYLVPFLDSLKRLRIDVKVIYADQMYKSGMLVPQIVQALEGRDAIARILQECTGRQVEEDWSPFNPICAQCRRLTETQVRGFSKQDETVDYTCRCGGRGTVTMRGGGKLTWRVDWPARWARIPVTVEPFGKDHATRGGSYDSGARICREVFKAEPPFPVTYEWIAFKGMGDMSKSKGNVLSVHRMLEVVPPEVLRYLVVKTRPMRSISFDPGLPLLALVDEFDDAASSARDPRAMALSGADQFKPIGVPFRHLVNVVQMADFDLDQAVVILKRNGYAIEDEAAVQERAGYAIRWIREFAPEEAKFSVQRTLPATARELGAPEREFLRRLAERLRPEQTGEEIHALIYDLAKEAGMEKTTGAFEAIYRVFLGRTRGPRAGWFLAFLDRAFVLARLREAAAALAILFGASLFTGAPQARAAASAPAPPSSGAAAQTVPASPRERYQKRFTGKPAPDFSLSDLAGNTVTLSQERGRVVLLNFWYSSCVPCRRETPDLATLHKAYSGHGFKVIGINLDDLLIPDAGGASLKVFLNEFKPPYQILLGGNDVMEAYGGLPVQPISFLIDRKGTVARVFWGAYPGAVFEKAIRAQLEAPSR